MRRRSSSPNTPSSESSPSSSDLPLAVPPIESIDVNGAGKEYDEARLFRAFINDNAFDSSVTTVVQPASIGFDRLHSVLSSAQRYHVPPATHVVKPSALIPPAAPPEPETETKPNPDVQVVHPPKENCNNLPVRVRNVPLQGAKSRVETQLKVTIDLVWDPTPRTHFHQASSSSSGYSADAKEELAPTVGSWEWLSLPPGSATKRRGRKEAKIAPTPAQTLTLHTMVHVASAPHTAARACAPILVLIHSSNGLAPSHIFDPCYFSILGTPFSTRTIRSQRPTSSELPDLSSLGCEDDKIVLYNCADVLDFKSGTVDLPYHFYPTRSYRSDCWNGSYASNHDHDDKSTARKVQAQQSAVPGGAGLVPPTPATAISTGPSLVAAIGASTMNGSRKGSKDKGGAKHRMKPYDRSRASSVGLTGIYLSSAPKPHALHHRGVWNAERVVRRCSWNDDAFAYSLSILSPPRSPVILVATPARTHPFRCCHTLPRRTMRRHRPTRVCILRLTRPFTRLSTPLLIRVHSPSRGILSGGMQSDFMDSLLGSTGGLLDMNGDPLLGMDSDTLMANTFAGTDTQMFDPTTTDPTNPDWEAMLQELTNQPPTSGLKPPTPQGAIYVEHPPWGVPATWPPESIDLAPPETTPIPRVSRVVPNSGPIQGGIEVTLLGENFSRAYECKFGDYVATETALGAGAVAVRIKGYENVPLRPGEREVMFTYKDDMDGIGAQGCWAAYDRAAGRTMQYRKEIVAVGEMQNNSNMVVTRLAQSIIESDVTPQDDENGSAQQQQEQGRAPTRQEELIQFLKLLTYPTSVLVVFHQLCRLAPKRNGPNTTSLGGSAWRGGLCARTFAGGADTEIVNAYGMAPIDVAREHARSEVMALLEGADHESDAVEEDEEGSELRAPSLDESTGADADESDLEADDERRSRVPAEVAARKTAPRTICSLQTPHDLLSTRSSTEACVLGRDPSSHLLGPNQVQLRARLARRLGYYPTEVTDREIRAYTHHSQKMRKLKKDRMLVLFWLPILLIVIAWGLYQSIPVAFKAMANTIRGYLPLASR
ncbi:ankyrin repeats [Rhizoctonia solani]|uniref:Ankyrin repeats n=1 Tax=Rhizoctonia solani TaxID=456999 RepID=A0A8H8SZQ5_9AGAM|nr:ankyrin repeats [Rhizoctonia solani]QRW23864.1 ankyrin repeats [Rhizoctonia solani]